MPAAAAAKGARRAAPGAAAQVRQHFVPASILRLSREVHFPRMARPRPMGTRSAWLRADLPIDFLRLHTVPVPKLHPLPQAAALPVADN